MSTPDLDAATQAPTVCIACGDEFCAESLEEQWRWIRAHHICWIFLGQDVDNYDDTV